MRLFLFVVLILPCRWHQTIGSLGLECVSPLPPTTQGTLSEGRRGRMSGMRACNCEEGLDAGADFD